MHNDKYRIHPKKDNLSKFEASIVVFFRLFHSLSIGRILKGIQITYPPFTLLSSVLDKKEN